MDNKDNLPQVIKEFPIEPLTARNTLDEVQHVDAKQLHYAFCRLGDTWANAETNDDIFKCIMMQTKLQKERRDLLGHPRAHKSSEHQTFIVNPID